MTTQQTTNTTRGTSDWMRLIAQCMFEGGQAFLHVVSSTAPTVDDAQLAQDEDQADRRLAKALANARRTRQLDPYLISAARNWSRKQAYALLREKAAGKPTRLDFSQRFQNDLQHEIETMIADLQDSWEQENQQQSERKRAEAEKAFGAASPLISGLHDAVLSGERQRQVIFESGQTIAQQWAHRYEESVRTREQQLEERAKLLQQQEQQNREYQLALRSLSKWDDRNSFANSVVHTGKNAIGCFLLWFLLIVGILLAIYFAFPHH